MLRSTMPVLLALGIFIAGCQSVRDLPLEEQRVQVVHETKLAKDVIYLKTLEWFASTFNDSKAVLEVQDKESGTVMGKGVVPDGVTCNGPIPSRFELGITIKVEAKDQKYRVTYSDFRLGQHGQTGRDLVIGTEFDTAKATAARLDAELAAFIEASAADRF